MITFSLYCGQYAFVFFHVTLCVSTVFAMAQCLSVTFVHSIQTFVGLVAHHSSFFTPSTGTQIQGESLQRGCKIEGGGKNFVIFI